MRLRYSCEVARVRELVGVALGVVGPDVLDLVALAAALRVLGVARRHAGARLDVVGHAREQAMDLAAVHAVQAEAVVAGEGLGLGVEPLAQQSQPAPSALLPRMSRMTRNIAYCIVE